MFTSAPEAYVQQYTSRTGFLLQQMGSKLVQACMPESYTGKAAQVVAQFGSVEAQEIVNRHADTILADTPMTSRWIRPSDWGTADMVDKEDVIRSLIDPKSSLSGVQAMALGRKQDDIILSGVYGSNFTGQDGGTSLTFAADGGTVLPVNPLSATQMRIMRKTWHFRIFLRHKAKILSTNRYGSSPSSRSPSSASEPRSRSRASRRGGASEAR